MDVILVDPGAENVSDAKPGAARLSKLEGMRIGLLDNIKHNAVYLLEEVGERLARDFGCEVRMIKKKTYTRFAEPHVMEQLAGCQGVITAIGD